MSSVAGWQTWFYLIFGPIFASAFRLIIHLQDYKDELPLKSGIISFMLMSALCLIPFTFIAGSLGVVGVLLRRIPIYTPIFCSIIPFLLIWGLDIHMLGDPPKSYWSDLPDALGVTIVPSIGVWFFVRLKWGPART